MTNKTDTDKTNNDELLTQLFTLPDEKNIDSANNRYFTQVVIGRIHKEIWLHNIVMAVSISLCAIIIFWQFLPSLDSLSLTFTSALHTILSVDFYTNISSSFTYIAIVLVLGVSSSFLSDIMQD